MICVFGSTRHRLLLSVRGFVNVTRFSLSILSLRHNFPFNLNFLLTLASDYSSLYGHHRCSFVNLKLNVDLKKAITNFMAKINVSSINELILFFAPFLSKSRDLIFFNLLKKFKLSLVGRMIMIFDNFDGLT